MASSFSSPRTWKYNVFTSFHGPDVRQTFLSHLRKQFKLNGITMFDDTNGIERNHIIGPSLTQAIRESRIFIVVLSKNYASSRWCLDELLEILKCSENEQRVMTVFHGVDPFDVRKQAGDFGIAFSETCAHKTEEEQMRKWSQALTYVGNIAGEHFKTCKNEAEMIEKIARDVSDKLNVTPSRDFDGMVGLEAHLSKVESLLDLDNDGVKIVGISGPAGIGKSTIARAIHDRHSNSFPLSCFMENLKGSYQSGSDEYSLRLQLQEQFLSKILNLNGMKIRHSGVIKDRLHNQKVLIILDDVKQLDQLEALANIGWFGHGSRVIVTTENKEILKQHGINDIYHVAFPSRSEARMIFCLSAFRQTSPPDGFMNLANEVTMICGDLPLGLRVLGSSLRGKSQADWIAELPRLKNSLDGKIESVLKVGYENLHEKDQDLFLFIAVFFNHEHVDHVTSMLAKSNWEFRLGLKNLANRCLIHYEDSIVVMHHLLQVMARKVISKQEPWKRQILVDAQEICDVLENAEGNRSIKGVSFNVAEINNLVISARAFERMCNLFFLKVYNVRHNQEIQWQDIEFPSRLRLLHWNAYPQKSLPSRFCPENLIELNMEFSQLEKLWEGNQLLANLKKINLSWSSRLKELPDLSNATNLERLKVSNCIALVELPSSISNLTKLEDLYMRNCESLEVIPRLTNLASTYIHMNGCSRLSSFPDLPTKIKDLGVKGTAVEELPASLTYCSRLEMVVLSDNGNLKAFLTELPTSVRWLDLSNSGIERITDSIKGLHNLQTLDISKCKRLVSLPELPTSVRMLYLSESGIERITDSIKGLHNLEKLDISKCKRLVSLPELPCSLKYLNAKNCDSLERVSRPFNTPNAKLDFRNCLKLDQKARQAIIQQSFVGGGLGLFPGRKVPEKFNHRARGNSLTIPYSAFNRFKVCVVISPHHQAVEYMMSFLLCRCIVIGDSVNSYDTEFYIQRLSDIKFTDIKFFIYPLQTEHLFIFHIDLPFIDPWPSEVKRKIVIEFSTSYFNIRKLVDLDTYLEIIECGVEILTDETSRNNNGESGDEDNYSDFRDVTIANRRSESESAQVSDKEDDEEEYKSEYGEAFDNKVEDITDGEGEYQSVPRKRKMISATTDLRKEIQRPGFRKKKRKMNHMFKKFWHCIGSTSGQKKAKRVKY